MDFRTKVDIPVSDIKISHTSRICMFGSCFVENIGELLTDHKFDVNTNPFGILYNPLSIEQALDRIIERRAFSEDDIFEHKGIYNSFYHHSRFSDIDKKACLIRINREIERVSNDLSQTDILFITFGTAYAYKLKENNLIVGNCHKLPASIFNRFRLSVNQIVETWNMLIKRLQEVNPKLEIIFTVSPIRHMKDGAYENQLSKSTLLLAIDEIRQSNNKVHYFPSYEIVLDELRDYRFYAEDMIHPSSVAIKYIWKKFCETYLSAETMQIADQWLKIKAAISHRPFNEKSAEHKLFLRQTLLKLQTFNQKYPYICSENETASLEAKIKD